MGLNKHFQSKRDNNNFLLEGDISTSLHWDTLNERRGSNAIFLLLKPGKHSQLPKQSKSKESGTERCISQAGFAGSGI